MLHQKESLEFKTESSIKSEHDYDLVKKVMDKIFEHLKVLHTKSHVTDNDQLVDIERRKAKYLAYIEEDFDLSNFQMAKIPELSKIVCVIRREAEKFKSRISKVEELTEMHDY